MSLPVTQRAYTLRLKGADPQDKTWRENLWKTHEAVNKGAKAFGDWLLTLRGGLCHTLVDEKVPQKGQTGREPTDQEKKDCRVLLALSWLSVESEKGAPVKYVVATGKKSLEDRKKKILKAFEEILKSRGVSDNEIKVWVEDCNASLSAAIRDDAVWVNRSKAFNEAASKIGASLTRDEIWDMLEHFFGSRAAYLSPAKSPDDDEDGEESTEEKVKDLVQRAGNWLSLRGGEGKGANYSKVACQYKELSDALSKIKPKQTGNDLIDVFARACGKPNGTIDDIFSAISYTGSKRRGPFFTLLRKLGKTSSLTTEDLSSLTVAVDAARKRFNEQTNKRKNKSKGSRPYSKTVLEEVSKACGFQYAPQNQSSNHKQYAVMLDHAARRVSLAHTWIKRAEAERRKFEEDAQKMGQVPANIKQWLDNFCEDRTSTEGALGQYYIRKRAVEGWEKVVKAWSKCKTEEERISAVGEVQAECQANDEKFGDNQLFESLAGDDAVCVWQIDGKPAPQPFLHYVAASEAENKKRRFKVPAYRHPDALLHPVFCDFGNSRWEIEFSVHQVAQKKKPHQKEKDFLANPHALKMGLWNGTDVKTEPILCWESKRLVQDLALNQSKPNGGNKAVDVARADRISRAAAGCSATNPVSILNVFNEKHWNGRLQAPRAQLNAIAKIRDSEKLTAAEKDERTAKRIAQLHWLISFSPKLQPQGPWTEFAQKNNLKPNPKAWPHNEENKKRQSQTKLILSRLPGLRVLSVDLGHRYAAACAVWETLTKGQVEDACKNASCENPKPEDLYLHVKCNGKTTIYRRIGPDKLDGKEHPAPWARLDRQFLIKLQGEQENARKASPAEIDAVKKIESELGRVEMENRSLQVDDLMCGAVATARLALMRHGDCARIAYGLTQKRKLLPGGREADHDMTKEELTAHLQDVSMLWHDLASSTKWKDDWAKEQWKEHIEKLPGYKAPEEIGEDISGKERKKKREANKAALLPVAQELAKRVKLHSLWATRWREEDGTEAKTEHEVDDKGKRTGKTKVIKDATGWRRRLRWLHNWILPCGKKKNDRAIRHVGGLSLTRIATIKSLYQVQKAFYTRLTPEGRQMEKDKNGKPTSKPVTADEGFGQAILDTMEHLRENRVKQLASRIAEAALGIGREHIFPTKKEPNKKCWCGKMHGKKDIKRPRERISNPRFAPCHAVAIENLTHYRPEETRLRRENRALMNWASSKVKKFLAEACQLNGLHLREVTASYTSRQDSRTGAPGIRCQDVSVTAFLKSQSLIRAEKKKQNEKDARDKYILDLKKRVEILTDEQKKNSPPVRIPLKSGELFVSADENSPARKGIQADLNAAANIGLKALFDPDWEGKWWYVLCNSKDFKPAQDKVKGSTVFKDDKPLLLKKSSDGSADKDEQEKSGKRKKKEKQRDVINLWRDPADQSVYEGEWLSSKEYWNKVQYRVIDVLRKQGSKRGAMSD